MSLGTLWPWFLLGAQVRVVFSIQECDLAIVGAGIGGAYAAWQAADAGKTVCVFEQSERPGGRIHSLRHMGPKKDLVVEAGAYRFAPELVCEQVGTQPWCIHTPITAASVKQLGLRAGIYDPEPKQWDYKMRILVDSNGHDVGYLTLVETMLARAAQHGSNIQFGASVVGLSKMDNTSSIQLHLASSSSTIVAGAVLLNIPQLPLLKLMRHSTPPFGKSFSAPLHAPASFPIMKLYVHYEDAWWRNYLGLVAGPFDNKNITETCEASHVIHMHDVPCQSPAPLQGQYHDGDTRCDGPGGKCRGYLQAFYSGGTAIDYYKTFHSYSGDSVTYLSADSGEHRELLHEVHTALVKLHAEKLRAAGVYETVASQFPQSGLLSIWSESVTGVNAGCHVPKAGNRPHPEDLPKRASQPFSGQPVFVANEAYGPVPCFAEGSLNMSVAALEHLGIPRPSWLPLTYESPLPPPRTDPFLFMHSSVLHEKLKIVV